MIRYLSIVLLCLISAGMAFAADSGQANAPTTQPHALPADASTAIITYDYMGGMIRRVNPEPVLVIHADGTVRIGDPYGVGKGADAKLTAEDLQSLLHEILDVQQLATIDNDDLKLPGNVRVTDGQTVTIAVTLPELEKKLSAHGLMVGRNDAADAPKARFMAIRHQLDHLVDIAKLGGSGELTKVLAAINQEIKKNLPNEPQVEAGELAYVRMNPDGSSLASFNKKVSETQGWHMVWATATRTADGNITVEVKRGQVQHDK